jgi:3-methylfumaryl-CoA hydratase
VLLFQYAAVTYNTHCIHYDHPFATGVEGYPGLIVHGPLTATLMIDLLAAHAPRRAVSTFTVTAPSVR